MSTTGSLSTSDQVPPLSPSAAPVELIPGGTPPASRRSVSSSPPEGMGLLATSAARSSQSHPTPGTSESQCGTSSCSSSFFTPMAASTPSLVHSSSSIPNPMTLHSILSNTLSNRSTAEAKRKPSLHVALPKFGSQVHNGSSDSLNKSPHSPGSIHGEDPSDEKERSYKVQRKNYRKEKQRVAQELNTALKDPSIIILSGALKVRGKLKGWTKLWAVLKPGLLLLYKSSKVKGSNWVATILLYCCKIIQRPSKKDGFCFKVFHPLEQSIWATKGPDGETMGAVVQPLPTTYLICRAASVDDGKCWMDGLELALTCSSLLVRSPRGTYGDLMDDKCSTETEPDQGWCCSDDEDKNRTPSDKSDSDTSHVEEPAEDEFRESDEDNERMGSDSHTSLSGLRRRRGSSTTAIVLTVPKQSNYIPSNEDYSSAQGEHTEELAEENKSLLWFLIKQVRPGMDLSRVVLPTFILEPRSFLDKLSDYYYHADYLSAAVVEDDPFTRMKYVLRWYLSGFYKKPKGLKKPYNPVLGETFRCMWKHPNGSNTFYIAEQVSHHPPISAFYVSNKKDGFAISAAIIAKSKFYGNSTSAILEGQATLTLLPRGEVYMITMPFAHCKGILLGTLSMELGGHVTISCDKTGYQSELEFKLKSFLSRSDNINGIAGKIKLGRETLANIDGHWDSKIIFKDKRTSEEEVLWEVTEKIKASRLKRFTIPLDEQRPCESEKLWSKVSEAILKEDQEAATVEKTILEEQQRNEVKERHTHKICWNPRFFTFDGTTWRYKFEDTRPWDDGNDIMEYELDYIITTHRKHETPVIRAGSITSLDCDILRDVPSDKVVPAFHQRESNRQLVDLLRQLLAKQIQQSEQIQELKEAVTNIQARLAKPPKDPFPVTNAILAVVFAVGMQILMLIYWFGDGKLIPEMKPRRQI